MEWSFLYFGDFQLWGFGVLTEVTRPLGFALAFRPGTPWTIRTETVNITPHFTVNRPCPCAARTPQGLNFQGFSVFVPKMLFFGTLTEIYIVYKTRIVYNRSAFGLCLGVRCCRVSSPCLIVCVLVFLVCAALDQIILCLPFTRCASLFPPPRFPVAPRDGVPRDHCPW